MAFATGYEAFALFVLLPKADEPKIIQLSGRN
jgi:hypothetical protein